MIARLVGTVAHTTLTHIILDVNGVGYLIAVRNPTDFALDETAAFYTHLAVRETALDLYGFSLIDEQHVFQELLKIPKIGPKSAMQILVRADLELLRKASIEQDAPYLSKMSGISKKMAEKVVAGLSGSFAETDFVPTKDSGNADSDVIDALIALGYSQKDARDAVQKLTEAGDTNTRITEALKLL